mgnify:CR=1 FL=1|jgi:hypothetical protein
MTVMELMKVNVAEFNHFGILPLNLQDHLIFKGLNREHLVGAFHLDWKIVIINPYNSAFRGEYSDKQSREKHMEEQIVKMMTAEFGFTYKEWEVRFSSESMMIQYWDGSMWKRRNSNGDCNYLRN